jgi:hypothetical protein
MRCWLYAGGVTAPPISSEGQPRTQVVSLACPSSVRLACLWRS